MVCGVMVTGYNKEIVTDEECFHTGMGVPGQLGRLRSLRCSGLAWMRP